MPDDFDPYHQWLGIPPKDQPPHAYRLLGTELFESDAAVLESAAEQRMLLLRTKASGPRGAIAQRLLDEVSAAANLLLDPEQRKEHDRQLTAQLSPAPVSAVAVRAVPAPPPVPSPPIEAAPPTEAALPAEAMPPAVVKSSETIGRRPTAFDLQPLDWAAFAFVLSSFVLLLTLVMSCALGGSGSDVPATSEDFLYKVKIVSATWGVGDKKVDVTEKIREQLAKDPFSPVQGDDRHMGDPAQGQHKYLEVNYEADGQPGKLTLKQGTFSSVPALPSEGVPLPSGSQEFRIVAVRYGAGTTWLDVTANVKQRCTHPGEPVPWVGMAPHDPWFGVLKHYVIWFDYRGKRYIKVVPENFPGFTTKPLVEGVTAPKRAPFTAEYKLDYWRPQFKPIALASNERAFCVATEFAGQYNGTGDLTEIALDANNMWVVQGEAQSPIAGQGMTVTTPLRDKFVAKPDEYAWKTGMQPIKMIHHSEGFCVLSSVRGRFGGAGEGAFVAINPQDGFWYLKCLDSNGTITAKAIAYRLKPNTGVKLRYVEYFAFSNAFKILEKDQGFCYISGMHGVFNGFNESSNLRRSAQGHWELHARNCSARAIAVIVEQQ